MNPQAAAIKANPLILDQRSQRAAARTAGVLYLVIIAAGIFAEFFVRGSLIVPGDAARTAENIRASAELFRLGMAGDLVMIICDVAIGLIFYRLFRPVNRTLSLLAAFFRLAQATAIGVNLINLVIAATLLGGAGYLASFEPTQLAGLAALFVEIHGVGYALSMIFFGFSLMVLGYLVIKSDLFPGWLGVLLLVASAGYLVDSFAQVVLTNYAEYEPILGSVVFLPAFIAELTMGIWLLVKGVRAGDSGALPAVETGRAASAAG